MHQPTSLYFGAVLLGAALALAPVSGVGRPEASLASAKRMAEKPRTLGASAPRIRGDSTKLPLVFEVNRGQLDSSVQYRARGPGFDLLLEHDGMRFETIAQQNNAERPPPAHRPPGKRPPKLRPRKRQDLDWRALEALEEDGGGDDGGGREVDVVGGSDKRGVEEVQRFLPGVSKDQGV